MSWRQVRSTINSHNQNQTFNQSKSSSKISPNMKFNMIKSIYTLVVVSLVALNHQVNCSGVFEINFSSLVDAFGRDLRDDCCSWQNQSLLQQQHQQAAYLSSRNQIKQQATTTDQVDSCDPKKCQLIVRICVKNYQSQEIEASQCTFGELTAQVNPSNNHNQYQANSLQQQQAQMFGRQTINTASNRFDVHYQKLHQPRSQQAALKPQLALASSQARALRQISFRQSISFPFNFTWPVSVHLIVI